MKTIVQIQGINKLSFYLRKYFFKKKITFSQVRTFNSNVLTYLSICECIPAAWESADGRADYSRPDLPILPIQKDSCPPAK